MDNIIKASSQELLLAAQSTFETITFASVEPSEEYNVDYSNPDTTLLFHSSIDIMFSDNTVFSMELALANEYLKTLIQSVNPMIEVVDDSMLIDFIGELINTLAGSFMLKIESQTGEFRLGLPVSQIGVGLSKDDKTLEEIFVVDDMNPVYISIAKK